MAEVFTPENLVALLTLASLEIVLGIDNIVLITIMASRLEPSKQAKARFIGLALAMITRILLLLSIKWVMGLTKPWFSIAGFEITGKDFILIGGGLFLIAKATFEIHDKIEGGGHEGGATKKAAASFGAVIAQILALDIIFSLDSVITAVGMVKHIPVMVIAVIIAVIVMMVFAAPIGNFIVRHPTIKMLALSFLLLIGVLLLAEGLHKHIERGYVYFAMAFSLMVELLNLKIIKHPPTPQPVQPLPTVEE